jgi:hypothetical protein
MGTFQKVAPAPAVELTAVEEYFVSGIDRIEPLGGGNYRIVLYVNEPGPDPTGDGMRVVKLKVIGSIEGFPEAIGQLLAVLGKQVIVTSAGLLRTLN